MSGNPNDDSARDFSLAVGPACRAISHFAVIAKETAISERLPGADSPAIKDLAIELNLRGEHRKEPVAHAQFHAGMLVYFALDHLDALAAVLPNVAVGPVFAPWSLLRPIADVCARAVWMNDPDITAEVRVRRALELERDSLHTQQRRHPPGLWPDVSRNLNRLNKYERERGWTDKTREKAPTAVEQFGQTVFGGQDRGLGRVLWHMASGSEHADYWALTQTIGVARTRDTDRQLLAGIVVDPGTCLLVAATAALAVFAALATRLAYIGVGLDQAEELSTAWDAVRTLLLPHMPKPTA